MTNEELEARLDDIDAQLRKLWTLHGLPTWARQEKQRKENQRAQGTRLPTHQISRTARATNHWRLEKR